CECYLARITFWKPDTEQTTFWQQAKEVKAAVDKEVKFGLIEGRGHDRNDSGRPQGNSYLRHRSTFLLAQGRAAWLDQRETAFKDAYQYFEMARGGIDPTDHLLQAQPDLFCAECVLVHADQLLAHQESDMHPSHFKADLDVALRLAEVKYTNAATY